MIHIYCDGSTQGNGNKYAHGGFGVIVFNNTTNSVEYKYSRQSDGTTNNREELKAIIHAFELAENKYPEELCIIHSDSAYCVNICNDWIHTWAKNRWFNSKNKTVENLDLVKIIYKYVNVNSFSCHVEKVQGHFGIIGNELADALARDNKAKYYKIIKENNIIDYTEGH